MKLLQIILIILSSIFFSDCSGTRESIREQSFTIEVDGYIKSCAWYPVVSVKDNGTWRQWNNPFNSGKTPLCYLDDQFKPMGLCDYVTCQKISTLTIPLVEYIQVGMKQAPLEVSNNIGSLPMYKTVSLHGEIKVQFGYFADSTCRNEKTITVTFNR